MRRFAEMSVCTNRVSQKHPLSNISNHAIFSSSNSVFESSKGKDIRFLMLIEEQNAI